MCKAGISLTSGSENIIISNNINVNGPLFEGIAIYLASTWGNQITDNEIANNIGSGIFLDHAPNPFANDPSQTPNILSLNTISSNTSAAIFIDKSNGNIIFNNNLLNNVAPQILFVGNNHDSFYNIGAPWGENFWSDHPNTDPFFFAPEGVDCLPWSGQDGWSALGPPNPEDLVGETCAPPDTTPPVITMTTPTVDEVFSQG